MNCDISSIVKSILLGLLTAYLISSCSEVVEEKPAAGGMRVAVTEAVDSTMTPEVYRGLHTVFHEGDAVGIYAVSDTGVVAENVRCTLTREGWIVGGDMRYNPSLVYYAYYPYSEDAYRVGKSRDADSLFAAFTRDSLDIFWHHDQSAEEGYRASNLMIAVGEADSVGIVFRMRHKRGVVIIPGVESRYYYSYDPETKYPVRELFSSSVPYARDGVSYFLVKPDSVTVIRRESYRIGERKGVVAYRNVITPSSPVLYSGPLDGEPDYSLSRPCPDWLLVRPKTSREGFVDYEVTVSSDSKMHADSIMQSEKEVRDYDLSMHYNDGAARTARTTANCYLVHAPGTYRIPLVYGNGIRDGVEYPVSIGDSIDCPSPWISSHTEVTGARLVWEDVRGLIKDVRVDSNYIVFTASRENIREGNAVIEAVSGSSVVWRWHVWVTKEKLTDNRLVPVNVEGVKYRVMPVALGRIGDFGDNECQVLIRGSRGDVGFTARRKTDWMSSIPSVPCHPDSTITARDSLCTMDSTVAGGLRGYGFYSLRENRRGVAESILLSEKKNVFDPCPPGFFLPSGSLSAKIGEAYKKVMSDRKKKGDVVSDSLSFSLYKDQKNE